MQDPNHQISQADCVDHGATVIPLPNALPSAADEARARLVLLMKRVAQKDRSAFQDLYRATSAKLYGTVLRILPDGDQASDVIQDAYVKIWERAADFNPGIASPITWLVTIARNRALDEVRRRRPDIADDYDLSELAGETAHPLDGRSRSEELKRLLACLDMLDDEKRQMVLLAYYRGCTREALSQKFGRPVPTVKTLLHRSLAQLRGCLSQ